MFTIFFRSSMLIQTRKRIPLLGVDKWSRTFQHLYLTKMAIGWIRQNESIPFLTSPLQVDKWLGFWGWEWLQSFTVITPILRTGKFFPKRVKKLCIVQ